MKILAHLAVLALLWSLMVEWLKVAVPRLLPARWRRSLSRFADDYVQAMVWPPIDRRP